MIISIVLAIASLLTFAITYILFIRRTPRLDVIELFRSSTSSFDNHINDLEFSFKGNTYEEISSTEFLLANRSIRSIEKDDINEGNPLQFYVKGDGIIHDIQLIKKIGDSEVDFQLKDDKSVSIDIESMDRGSRIRIEVLSSGKDYTIEAKGKLHKANHSISRLKRITGGLNVSELISSGFRGVKVYFRLIGILTPIFIALFLFLDYSDGFPEARIVATDNYREQQRQFVLLDSLQESEDVKSIHFIVENENNSLDTFELKKISTYWTMKWWADGDPIVRQISDSLAEEGYKVNIEHRTLDQSLMYGNYKLLNGQNYKGYSIIVRRYTWDFFKESFINSLIGSLGFAVGVFIMVIIIGFKNIRSMLRFRKFLTTEEKEEIEKNFPKYSLTGLMFKVLVK